MPQQPGRKRAIHRPADAVLISGAVLKSHKRLADFIVARTHSAGFMSGGFHKYSAAFCSVM